jgi:hypothetical protein
MASTGAEKKLAEAHRKVLLDMDVRAARYRVEEAEMVLEDEKARELDAIEAAAEERLNIRKLAERVKSKAKPKGSRKRAQVRDT